eukprot:s84_g14.t1
MVQMTCTAQLAVHRVVRDVARALRVVRCLTVVPKRLHPSQRKNGPCAIAARAAARIGNLGNLYDAQPFFTPGLVKLPPRSAHFISYSPLRWSLVIATFFMYFCASKDMVSWAQAYKNDTDPDVSGTHLRQASTLGLVAFFGLYGLVYLCRLTNVINDYEERVWYLCMNITTKLIMLMLFGGIRSSRYHDLIVNMLVNTHFSFRRQVAVMDPEHAGGTTPCEFWMRHSPLYLGVRLRQVDRLAFSHPIEIGRRSKYITLADAKRRFARCKVCANE